MVTKWKGFRYIAILVVLLCNFLPVYDGCTTDFQQYRDYQQDEDFMKEVRSTYNKVSWMTEYNHESMMADQNLLYKVTGSNMNYSNEDSLYVDGQTGKLVAPDGYNFLVYYDGTTIHLYKNGEELADEKEITSTWNKRSCIIMMAYAKKPVNIEGSATYEIYRVYEQKYNEQISRFVILLILAIVADICYGLRRYIMPGAVKAFRWCRIQIRRTQTTLKKWKNACVDFYRKHSYKYKMKIQVQKALEEQMEAERMKLELITNVSHDLKTPLTSIINYVQLLKSEEMSEDARTYVQIIDQKSERLKNMVLDVFAISKAAAGQLEIDLQQLDFGKLIAQTVADMNQEIENSTVTFKLDIPYEPVEIITDGNRMFRVFQNLIDNAIKYSLEHSRVYISLTCHEDKAVACIKNVSRDELNSKVDYTDRFVRGDKNRSEAGSGLGLAIAKSFTEYCGGTFSISADADLFTANVTFPMVKKEGNEEEEADTLTQEMPEELKVIIEQSKNQC